MLQYILDAILLVGCIASEMIAVFRCLMESTSTILAISSNMFAQVRQNPKQGGRKINK
jgi:uncharacterized protein YcfL